MTPRKRQQGLTAVGMVLVLSCIALFSLMGIRLLPMYIESFKVDSAMKSLDGEEGLAQKTPAEIKELILKRLDIDDVDDVAAEHIAISRNDGKLVVDINYQVRSPLFSNIELLGTYTKHHEVTL